MRLAAILIILSIFTAARANRDTFMVGGNDVNEAVPFYAYLEIYSQPNIQGNTYFGGGTLITEYSILTVAQNVYGFQSWLAGLGSYTIDGLIRFRVETYAIHPHYNASDLANNIAILNLVQPVSSRSQLIRPIVLAPGGTQIPQYQQVGNIVGFGFGINKEQPKQLQYSQMIVWSEEECGRSYPHLIRNGQLQNHFCASNSATNICAGDQGGPMYSVEWGLMFGIQSFNRIRDCNQPASRPAAFIMVSRYGEWITQNSIN